MNSTSCGVICQHPGCWNGFKMDMIDAYNKKFGGVDDVLLGPNNNKEHGTSQSDNECSIRSSTGIIS